MQSNFPIEFVRSATGGVSWQTSTDVWKRREFFSSVKTTCLGHEYDEKTAEAQAAVDAQIEQALEDLKNRIRATGATPIDGTADPAPYVEPYLQRREEPEESPFKVSAAPPTGEEYPDKTALEQAKEEFEEAKKELYEAAGEVLGFPLAPPEDPAHVAAPVQTGAPEPEPLAPGEPIYATTTARGRRKTTPKVEGPAAMEALKASAPPTNATTVAQMAPEGTPAPTGYVATTDDLPSNIASAPHEPKPTAPEPPKTQAERLDAIVTTLIKDNQKGLEVRAKQLNKDVPSVARGCLAAFMRGFQRAVDVQSESIPRAGNGKDKPDDPFYEANLPLFEGFARLYSGQLLSRAPEEGLKAGESWSVFVRSVGGWPEGFRLLVRDVAAQYHPDCATDLLGFLEDIVGKPEPSKSAEIWSFLQLMRIGKPALLAARDAAKKRGMLLSATVAGLDLDLAGEREVLSHLAGAAVQVGA